MKKVILTAVVLVLTGIASSAKAQVFNGPEPGTNIIGVHFAGAPGIGANVQYDYALARVWKGTFTIGGHVGYTHRGVIPIMARTTYRLNVLVPEWEVYAGVMMGAGVVFAGGASGAAFIGDFVLGSTYFFTDQFGVNLEFDLGSFPAVPAVNIGVVFRF